MEQEYLEIQKDNKAFHEEVVGKKMYFSVEMPNPSFRI